MKRLVIYTAIFGGKDSVKPHVGMPDADFYLFTDDKELKSDCWNIVRNSFNSEEDPRIKSRFYKVRPHLIFGAYKYSLWIDANQELVSDPSKLIDRHLSDSCSVAFTDVLYKEFRKSFDLYGEADLCLRTGRGDPEKIFEQVKAYREDGHPENFGLWGARFILRRHMHMDSVKLGEMWWKHVSKYSCRDQISLPYVLWKLGIDVETLNTSEYIKKHLHMR